MFRISPLLLTVITVAAVPNFQERVLYAIFNKANICDNGQEEDKIIININLDGFKQKRFVANGKTGCSQWLVEGWTRILPVDYWTYIDLPLHYIEFNEKVAYEAAFSKLWTMFTTTTIINPARIDGLDYNCIILGNGKRNHFGIDFPDFEPAIIELKCDNWTGKAVVHGEKMAEKVELI
jgi:hypothetical protein